MDNITIQCLPESCWYPAYTKPRCEKTVAEYCQRHEIPCYLPLLRRAKRYQRRTVETFLPMFSGYVFVQLDTETSKTFLQCHKIVHILPVTPPQEAMLVQELNEIQHMIGLQAQTELVVMPELAPGTPVLVSNGPFKGMSGIVDRRKNQTRITVNVEMLGQSVSAELDVGDVDPELP